MKDRLLTIGGGLLAFAVVVILLVPVDRDQSEHISRPLAVDRGSAGLQGMKRWLENGGVETRVLGRRYTALAGDLELSPVGNLLILSLPQRVPTRTGEREVLHAWLAQGNSALLLVAAGDAPLWMLYAHYHSTDEVLESLGFEVERSETTETGGGQVEASGADADPAEGESQGSWFERVREGLESEAVELVPTFANPLTRDVATVSTWTMPALDEGWRLTGTERGRVVLPLLARADGEPALWEARVGAGRMWVSRHSDLFSNGVLGKADNARLLANMVTSTLGANGRVIFDDMHQGRSDLYDAKAFFADRRFINTMIFFVGFWLLYLVGRSRRLAPARETVTRYYAADLARAMAGFFVRRLSAVSVERQLFVFFFNEIRSRYGLPTNGQPVWSILSGTPRVSAADVRALRVHYERAAAAKRPDLVTLARLMQRTRESLL